MIQGGKHVNLGDPLGSQNKGYSKTSRRGRELGKDPAEVGLVDSTLRAGKLFTRGSDQQGHDSLRDNRKHRKVQKNQLENKLKLIAKKAKEDKLLKFTSLAHHMNAACLEQCYNELEKTKRVALTG